jgi:hypothetical protein
VQLAMQRGLHTRGGPAAASRGRPCCFRHNAVCMQHFLPPRTGLICSAASDMELALQGLQKLRSRAALRDTPAPVSGTWQQLLLQKDVISYIFISLLQLQQAQRVRSASTCFRLCFRCCSRAVPATSAAAHSVHTLCRR